MESRPDEHRRGRSLTKREHKEISIQVFHCCLCFCCRRVVPSCCAAACCFDCRFYCFTVFAISVALYGSSTPVSRPLAADTMESSIPRPPPTNMTDCRRQRMCECRRPCDIPFCRRLNHSDNLIPMCRRPTASRALTFSSGRCSVHLPF